MVKTSLSRRTSLRSAVFIEHRPVTDRQTDIRGRDIHGTMRMRCVVSRGKNGRLLQVGRYFSRCTRLRNFGHAQRAAAAQRA